MSSIDDVDELNSAVDSLIARGYFPERNEHVQLIDLQQELLDVNGELRILGYMLDYLKRVAAVDAWLVAPNAMLPSLLEFARPGGRSPAAQAQTLRFICRRPERSERAEPAATSLPACQHPNRLSDLTYVFGAPNGPLPRPRGTPV